MKVLIFMTQFYQLGGAERLAVELAVELNKRGIHTDILSMYDGSLPGVAEVKEGLLEKGIPKVHFLGMKLHPSLISLIPAIVKLKQLIWEQGYNIIETSMGSPALIASLVTLTGRVRLVAGLHDVFDRKYYNGKKHRIWRFAMQINPRIYYYAISDYVKMHWIEYSNTSPLRIRTVYNGIPNECFEILPERNAVREELKIPLDSKIVLFVGRMLKRKGIDTILDAIGPLLKQENLCLVYVGGWDQPPEEYFTDEAGLLDRMRKRVVSENWEGHVRFLGRRDDVSLLMASSDILIHPARIEGFGLVLVEAMAAELPLVASNVGGIPEVLAGSDSIMVEPNDPHALREEVLKILKISPDQAVLFIEKGRKRAETFRIDNRVDAMVNLFGDVFSGCR